MQQNHEHKWTFLKEIFSMFSFFFVFLQIFNIVIYSAFRWCVSLSI